MKGRPKIPGSVIAGLVLAVVLDTIVQITWKLAVGTGAGVLSSPFFYVAMLALGAQFYNWMRVLAKADLSFAQPFTALSYVSVLLISGRSLHESISFFQLLGVGLILLGVFLVSRTPSRTGATQ